MAVSPGTRSESDVVDDLVRQYLREIGAFPLLTAADEVSLAMAIEAGREAQAVLHAAADDLTRARRRQLLRAVTAGEEARRQFIQANLRLVVSIAKRYRSPDMPLLDLVQEGNLGLMRAVEKFDHTRGFKFSTYATWWIRQAVSRAIADKARTIRLPAHVVELAGRVRRMSTRLTETYGREVTPEEIALHLGLAVHTVVEVQHLLPDPVSINAPIGFEGTELSELLEDHGATVPFDAAAAALQGDDLRAALCSLSERERSVLEMRFGLAGTTPLTLEEIGREFHLTRERIRQIEAKALARLRHPATPSNRRQLMALEGTRRERRRAVARPAPSPYAVN
ncbi:MAG: polymerase primary sigma factor [Actinomycetota bacterium]|jgi:RNA polymerase primary sigma factor|nr:polymerase primary sigma factor [Actinomycetota bacterium]